MPQFKMIPSREKILARIPDYAVEIEPLDGTVTVRHGDTVIAASNQAYLVKETRHDDVIYLPMQDMNMAYFRETDHSTYCPFKGHASYWQLQIGKAGEAAETNVKTTVDNIVWTYREPYEEVAVLKDYVSFYTDLTQISVAN